MQVANYVKQANYCLTQRKFLKCQILRQKKIQRQNILTGKNIADRGARQTNRQVSSQRLRAQAQTAQYQQQQSAKSIPDDANKQEVYVRFLLKYDIIREQLLDMLPGEGEEDEEGDEGVEVDNEVGGDEEEEEEDEEDEGYEEDDEDEDDDENVGDVKTNLELYKQLSELLIDPEVVQVLDNIFSQSRELTNALFEVQQEMSEQQGALKGVIRKVIQDQLKWETETKIATLSEDQQQDKVAVLWAKRYIKMMISMLTAENLTAEDREIGMNACNMPDELRQMSNKQLQEYAESLEAPEDQIEELKTRVFSQIPVNLVWQFSIFYEIVFGIREPELMQELEYYNGFAEDPYGGFLDVVDKHNCLRDQQLQNLLKKPALKEYYQQRKEGIDESEYEEDGDVQKFLERAGMLSMKKWAES